MKQNVSGVNKIVMPLTKLRKTHTGPNANFGLIKKKTCFDAYIVLFGIYIMFVQAQVTPAVALIVPLPPPPMSSPITTSIVSLLVVIGPVKTLAGILFCPVMHLPLHFTSLSKH